MAEPDKTSYKSPYYTELSSGVEAKLGLPKGLLNSIVNNGERSNADQVSEADARTVYQIIPATRNAGLKAYGIDAYASPENAALVAGNLLKDSLKRNKGDVKSAISEYVGGTDRKNWGKVTTAYADRVLSAMMGEAQAAETEQSDALLNDLKAFKATQKPVEVEQVKPEPADNKLLVADLKAWKAKQPAPVVDDRGLLQKATDIVTGNDRKTAETESLPDWAGMPELNQLSIASAKTGAGTMLSNPAETAQIIHSNYPDAKIRQDEKGNYLITSPSDGKEYAIKPGFRVSDIPRALGALLAFTPAGRAESVAAQMAGSAATQAGIEATQAGTGGEFNGGDVAAAGLIPLGVKALTGAGKAVTNKLKSLLPNAKPIITENPAAVASEAVAAKPNIAAEMEVPVTAKPQVIVGDESSAVVDDALASAKQAENDIKPLQTEATLSADELAQTAKSAAQGNKGAVTTLAEEAAPNQKILESAKRLGIEEHLQPDHVTTNQAYRELSQAAKSIPGSAARSAEITGLERIGQRADKIISDLGGTDDSSMLNDTVKKQLQAIHAETKNQATKLFDEIRESIPAKSPVKAENTVNLIKNRAEELGGVENLTGAEKNLLSKLQPKAGKQPTYALLDSVRKDLNEAATGKGEFKDTSDYITGQLKKALFSDQEAAAAQLGKADAFAQAQATSKLYLGMQDDLKALFGKTLDDNFVGDLSASVKSLPAGDITKFTRLVGATKYLPEETRQQLVASGLHTAFGKSFKRGDINFGSYAHWYEGLTKNKRAHAALMSNLPKSARKQLSDLYRVSKGISEATKERITTGRIMAYKDAWKGADSMMGKLYEAAMQSTGRLAAGMAADVVGAGGVGMAAAIGSALTKAKTPAIEAIDKLIASPEFIEVAKNPTKETVRKLAYSKQFTNAVRALKQPKEMSDREKWIIQTMQAANEEN